MNDDIVTRLQQIADADVHMADISVSKLYEAVDEIERLRTINIELVKMFKQVGVVAEIWQKTEDELIELHHGKCADQFAQQADEIERLRQLLLIFDTHFVCDECEKACATYLQGCENPLHALHTAAWDLF